MLHRDDSAALHSGRSPSGERRTKQAMKLQRNAHRTSTNSAQSSPGPQSRDSDDDSDMDGEVSPANSGIDLAFLRKIKRKTELSKSDQEVVRLIGQHLCNIGLKASADVLMQEAGCRLDQPTAATFRHCVMKGDWTGAVNVLEDLSPHLDNPSSQIEMKFLLLEQKYLENLSSGNMIDALKVLQLELTPLKHNIHRTHELSSFLMLPNTDPSSSQQRRVVSPRHAPLQSPPHQSPPVYSNHGPTSHASPIYSSQGHPIPSHSGHPMNPSSQAHHIMSHVSSPPGYPSPGPTPGTVSPPDVRSRLASSESRRGSPGRDSPPLSRMAVMERLQAYLPPSIMLPPRRLVTLLNQATQHQRDTCLYHNRLDDGGPPDTFAMDHQCSREMFPCETIQILGDHCDEIWYCKWSPNGRLLATGSKDYTVIIWELDTVTLNLRHSKVLEGHSYGVAFLAWSPDSTKLAVCGPEDCPEGGRSEYSLYNPSPGAQVWLWDVVNGRLETKVSHSGEDSLTCVSWSPDGRRVACGGNRGQFYQCDTHGTVLDSWEGVRVQCLSYRSDGRHILAADTHHRLRSYNFEELADQPTIQEDHSIMSFTIDQTDRYVLLNIATQGVHMWDITERCLVRKFLGITQGFYTIHSCFGGIDQSFVASGSEDNKVYIFHVKRDHPIAVLSGHTRTVNCVAWNPVYHQVLVSASDDNTVRVWGPAEQYRRPKPGHGSTNHPGPSSNGAGYSNGSG